MANVKLKVVKKNWHDIDAPSFFGNYKVGKTYLENPSTAVGRKLKVSYANVSGDPQKQNVILKLKITGVKDNNLKTELLGLELQAASVKRFVRKGKTKIEDSFLSTTKDGKKIRVKPLLVTRFKASGGVSNSLIKKVKEFLLKELPTRTLEETVKELLTRQFQKNISNALKSTYPVSISELRSIQIIESETVSKKTEEKKPEPANEEVPVAEA